MTAIESQPVLFGQPELHRPWSDSDDSNYVWIHLLVGVYGSMV